MIQHPSALFEQWYRQVAENLPNTAVAVFDPDLRMVVVAGEAVRANGSDPHAMTGKPLAETVSPALLHVLQGPRGGRCTRRPG